MKWNIFYFEVISVTGCKRIFQNESFSLTFLYLPTFIFFKMLKSTGNFSSHSKLLWQQFGPYSSMLLHWYWGNHMIAPVPVKQPWRNGYINHMNILKNYTATKKSKTKLFEWNHMNPLKQYTTKQNKTKPNRVYILWDILYQIPIHQQKCHYIYQRLPCPRALIPRPCHSTHYGGWHQLRSYLRLPMAGDPMKAADRADTGAILQRYK